MKISLDWIRDYIDFDVPVSRLIEVLDNIGLLIEGREEMDGDVVLDVETYANRPDTLGHMGIARELAAALGLSLKETRLSLAETKEDISDFIDVQIRDEDLCPRYCGMVVKDMTVGPSPEWLIKRLGAMGLKPINNVVDVTNYVLFATAQPIHAFDLDKLAGRKIIVRRAKQREKLLSLEEKRVDLTSEMLVIADEKKPVALAGVIGGEETSVSSTTRNVFIESAYFDPVSVRKTSKKTGIQTDAAYRFERGADISFSPEAARLAASLFSQFGGKVCRGTVDIYPKPRKMKTVMLRNHRVASLLGVHVDKDYIEKTLAALGLEIKKMQPGIWQVKIPYFRIDIEREADLVEEIARFYGYEKIPVQLPPFRSLDLSIDPKKKKIDRLRQVLFHYGFDEVVNFSFMDPEKAEKFTPDLHPVPIRNPISTKAAFLRTTLLGGLLDNVIWNINRGAEGVHIFEVGNIFRMDNDSYHEHLMLSVVMTGSVEERHWKSEEQEAGFFHLKGTCEALFSRLGYGSVSFLEDTHPHYQDGRCLALNIKGEHIGWLGAVDRKILDADLWKQDIWTVEVDLDLLFQKQAQTFRYAAVAKYPSMTRDVTFIGDKKTSYEEIRKILEKLKLPYLENFTLYDRFTGPSIPPNKVSLSFRFVFRRPDRTLQAEEVDVFQEKIIEKLKARCQFRLREGGKIDK